MINTSPSTDYQRLLRTHRRPNMPTEPGPLSETPALEKPPIHARRPNDLEQPIMHLHGQKTSRVTGIKFPTLNGLPAVALFCAETGQWSNFIADETNRLLLDALEDAGIVRDGTIHHVDWSVFWGNADLKNIVLKPVIVKEDPMTDQTPVSELDTTFGAKTTPAEPAHEMNVNRAPYAFGNHIKRVHHTDGRLAGVICQQIFGLDNFTAIQRFGVAECWRMIDAYDAAHPYIEPSEGTQDGENGANVTMVRETPTQKLTRECEIIWRNYELPSGDLRQAMQTIGDVADFAGDPYRFSEYKLKLTAAASQARAEKAQKGAEKRAAQPIYEDLETRARAVARWSALADAAGFPKHKTARGGLWLKALGVQVAVQEFAGTDEQADERIKAELDAWKAKQAGDANGQPLPDKASTGDDTLDTVTAGLGGQVEAVEDTDEPSDGDHADDLEQAENRRLDAADETLMQCDVCGGTIVEGKCDTCEAQFDADGKRIPSRPAAVPASAPVALTPDNIKAAGGQVWSLLKEAYPAENKEQWINRYDDLSGGFISASDRIRALGSIERALAEVQAYIAAHPAGADETPGSWDGEISGDLIIQAKALARSLRGPQTSVSIPPELLADRAWKSGLYSNVTSFDRAFMVIWEGIELGIPPTTALKHIQVTKSKEGRISTTQSIHLMLGLVFASGELEAFSVKDGFVTVKRANRPEVKARYNATGDGADKDARRAIRYILRQQFSDVLAFGLRVQQIGTANPVAVADQGVAAL